MNTVAHTYLFPNGMICTFDHSGNQIGELQGRDTPELREKISERIDEMTKFHGYTIENKEKFSTNTGDRLVLRPENEVKPKVHGWYQYIEMMEHHHIKNGKSIYRLECKLSGHYYFGQTQSLHARIYKHLQDVMYAVEFPSSAKVPPFHTITADIVRDAYAQSKKKKLWPFLRDSFKVNVLAFAAEKNIADMIESAYIKEHRGNPLCLNTNNVNHS